MEKRAFLEDEAQEEKVRIADLFLRNIHRYKIAFTLAGEVNNTLSTRISL